MTMLRTISFSEPQLKVLEKALHSPAFQDLIGSEEWSLTEEEEVILWNIINLIDEFP